MVRVSKADNVARKAIFLEGGLHARYVFLSPGNILTQNLWIPKVGEITGFPLPSFSRVFECFHKWVFLDRNCGLTSRRQDLQRLSSGSRE